MQRKNPKAHDAPNAALDDRTPAADEVDGAPKSARDEELRITVRKLDLPVRPRGVLAE